MRTSILLFSLLCIGLHIQAQNGKSKADDNDPKIWKQGFIVTKKVDTIAGKVRVPLIINSSFSHFRYKISFESGNSITTQYTVNDLTAFSYYKDSDKRIDTFTYRTVCLPEEIDDLGLFFCKLEADGACKIYSYITYTGYGGSAQEKICIQRGDSHIIPVQLIRFKKNMKELFEDCPLLVSKLDSRAYTYDNWEEMVRDYNYGLCK